MSSARADARMERLLHVLPAAMAKGGADLDDLAAALGSTPERILEDLEEVTSRVFYQPGGWPDDVQIFVEGSRVEVFHASGFERPVRLTRDETLCLAMALRGGAAAGHVADEEKRVALMARAEAHLAVPDVTADDQPGADGEGHGTDDVAVPERDTDPEGIRAMLIAAHRDRTPCAIWYVKAGAEDASLRVIHPYAIAYAEGAWYVAAHCTVEEGIRIFRLDRVLDCDLARGSYEIPADFEVEDVVSGGRVFFTAEGQTTAEVRVRYSPKIARWIRERGQWDLDRLEEGDDGAVVVRHDVTDPSWAVGHALLYGAEAEIVEPADVRALLTDVLSRIEA